MSLEFITIYPAVMALEVSDVAKLILCAVAAFPGKGLMVSNTQIGMFLNKSTSTISHAILELERANLVEITARQSRYRRIYLAESCKVKLQSTLQNSQSTLQDSGTTLQNPAKENRKNRRNKNFTHTLPVDSPTDYGINWAAYHTRPLEESEAVTLLRAEGLYNG